MLNSEIIETTIIPALNEIAQDKQWRIRLSIMEYLPSMCQKMEIDFFKEKILPSFFTFLLDPVYEIRKKTCKNLKRLADTLGVDWLEEMMEMKLSEFSCHPKCTVRINVLHYINLLREEFRKEFMNDKIMKIICDMKDDRVPNIKFNIARTLHKISPSLNSHIIQQDVIPILQTFMRDLDADVRFYSQKALQCPQIQNYLN